MDIKIITADLLLKMFKQGAYELTKHKETVDALNVFPVPDGDTGTNMSLTIKTAMDEVLGSDYDTVDRIAKAMSRGTLMGARGNSGVILSQIFRGFAKGCEGKKNLTSGDFVRALDEASKTAYKAVMKPVEGTILTVIRKTAEKGMQYADENVALHDLMPILIKEAKRTLDATPEYLDVLREAGVVDAGGRGLLYIFEGFHDAILGKESEIESLHGHVAKHAGVGLSPEDITFGYCTEFIIRGEAIPEDELRDRIATLGDSLVFVKDDDLVKCHIHTNNPGVALEEALKHGQLIKVKIDNMREQHNAIISSTEPPEEPEEEFFDTELETAFIAVASGDGMAKILEDLGVHRVITGGQTMNPSTEDLINAINAIPAETIFILPNNSNIILAANQAKELSDKDIHVIPTKTLPQGISALIAYNGSLTAEENQEVMSAAVEDVVTVQVTYAVRDSQMNGHDIKKDDLLGIVEGKIAQVGTDKNDVAYTTIQSMIDEDTEILTLYYGEDVSEEEAQALVEKLEAGHEDLEIELYEGGQPLYFYICSLE